TRLAVVTTRTATLLVVVGRAVDRWCFAASQAIAPIDPYFDADDAVGGFSFAEAVVDISAQGVQRHAAFAIPLAAGDFNAVQTTSGHDLDALGAQAHGVLHRTLHRTTEHDALFELLGDRICDQLSVD